MLISIYPPSTPTPFPVIWVHFVNAHWLRILHTIINTISVLARLYWHDRPSALIIIIIIIIFILLLLLFF